MTTLGLSRKPALFKTLGNDLRWRLLSALVPSDRNVQDLVKLVREKQNLVSYHLNRLQKQGLISEQRSIADGREIYYSINLTKLQQLFFSAGEALHPALNPSEEAQGEANFKGLKAPVSILFLCTHNSARSQMAEGILRAEGGKLVEVYSAGTEPGSIHPLAIKAMKTLDIDISAQHSKDVKELLDDDFDFVITVCDRAKESCPIFSGHPHQIHWSFPDPSEVTGSEATRLKAFEQIAQELNRRISYLLMMVKRSIIAS